MQRVIESLNHWVIKVPERVSHLSEIEVSQRPMPDKWSKKEILDHLCDSAINNLENLVSQEYFTCSRLLIYDSIDFSELS